MQRTNSTTVTELDIAPQWLDRSHRPSAYLATAFTIFSFYVLSCLPLVAYIPMWRPVLRLTARRAPRFPRSRQRRCYACIRARLRSGRHNKTVPREPEVVASALTTNVRRVRPPADLGSAPAVAFLAADPGAFAALGGQDVGVAGVGVAPAQVGLQVPGQDGVVGIVEFAMVNVRSGPNWASIGLAQERRSGSGIARRCGRGPGPDAGGGVRGEVVQDHVDGCAVGSGGPDALQRGQGVVPPFRRRTTPHSWSSARL